MALVDVGPVGRRGLCSSKSCYQGLNKLQAVVHVSARLGQGRPEQLFPGLKAEHPFSLKEHVQRSQRRGCSEEKWDKILLCSSLASVPCLVLLLARSGYLFFFPGPLTLIPCVLTDEAVCMHLSYSMPPLTPGTCHGYPSSKSWIQFST